MLEIVQKTPAHLDVSNPPFWIMRVIAYERKDLFNWISNRDADGDIQPGSPLRSAR
jgi:hypothetical protein